MNCESKTTSVETFQITTSWITAPTKKTSLIQNYVNYSHKPFYKLVFGIKALTSVAVTTDALTIIVS